jgi:hypothetical protein
MKPSGNNNALEQGVFVGIGINADLTDLTKMSISHAVVDEANTIKTDSSQFDRISEPLYQSHGIIEEFSLSDADLLWYFIGDQTSRLSL